MPASPRARRRMRQLGLSPQQIPGSGPNGRILEADVKTAAALAPAAAVAAPAAVSFMRRSIAEKTALSFASTPHFYLRVEADVTTLMEFREQMAPALESAVGVKVTLTDFLLHAMAQAVVKFPFANCIWQNQTLVKLPTVDLGLVVSLPDGLLIPILRQADTLTLPELAKRRADLTAAARAGRLSAADTQGGVMSLSNLGTSRVDEFAPVIAPPQSSMLAVGRAAPRPFVVQNQLTVRTTLHLCLAVDHRVMDGAPAADLLGVIVESLEHPGP
jgi:pyruvate dehydrogenase E2 component (dihydrolipoamide acetyltransferase)